MESTGLAIWSSLVRSLRHDGCVGVVHMETRWFPRSEIAFESFPRSTTSQRSLVASLLWSKVAGTCVLGNRGSLVRNRVDHSGILQSL